MQFLVRCLQSHANLYIFLLLLLLLFFIYFFFRQHSKYWQHYTDSLCRQMRWEVLEKVRCVKIAWIIFHHEFARIAGFLQKTFIIWGLKRLWTFPFWSIIIVNLHMGNKVSNLILFISNIYIYMYIYHRTQMKRWHNFSLYIYIYIYLYLYLFFQGLPCVESFSSDHWALSKVYWWLGHIRLPLWSSQWVLHSKVCWIITSCSLIGFWIAFCLKISQLNKILIVQLSEFKSQEELSLDTGWGSAI